MAGHRVAAALGVVLIASGCADAGRSLATGLEGVQVLEQAGPDPLPVSPGPLGEVVPPAPQLLYAEPAPLPPRHVVVASLLPSGSTSLRDVQAVELTVEITGGTTGAHEVAVLFVSPQGLAWERQARRVDITRGASSTARFTLPVANTLIEDHALAGTWSVTTLQDGAELAAATFEVAP